MHINMILLRFAVRTLTNYFCCRRVNKSRSVLSMLPNVPSTTNSRSYTHRGGTHDPSNVREIEIPLPYGKIAAKAWGRESAAPVLALHGWLSNCGTFDRLIPLLSDHFYFVAVDAPGHGRSAHHPPGFGYTDMSAVLDYKKIVDHLGWTKFHLLGHSLGASHAFLLSALFSDSVDKLVSLDAVKAHSLDVDVVPARRARAASQLLEAEKKLRDPPPVYDEKYVIDKIIESTMGDVDEAGARLTMVRGTVPSGHQGFVFSRDPRVSCLPYLELLDHDLAMALTSKLRCKLLIILANGPKRQPRVNPPEFEAQVIAVHRQNLEHFVLEYVDGNHMAHLNTPELVAPIINKFLLGA